MLWTGKVRRDGLECGDEGIQPGADYHVNLHS
jgi:hypothetical protein